MTPVAVIQTLLQVNPKVAKFILTGLAVLAAASIAVTWIGQNPYPRYVAGYILGLAFLATIIAFVATDRRMCMVLGWAVTATFVAFLAGLVDSAVGLSGRLPTPACYVRILFEPPQRCEQRLFPTIELASAAAPSPWRWQVASDTSRDSTVWRVQATAADRSPPYAGPISLQAAPGFSDTDMRALTQFLTAHGWPVARHDWSKLVPDHNEVRFFAPSAQADAIALAHAIKAQRPDSPIAVRDFSGSGMITAPGLLEIWLAN